MGTPYIHSLSSQLEYINWSLCQLHMRSSYMGYGTGSLQRDFDDISACISYLLANGKRHIVLMGHSTGCQNSIHYILNRLNQKNSPPVNGVIVYLPHTELTRIVTSPRQWSRNCKVETRRCAMGGVYPTFTKNDSRRKRRWDCPEEVLEMAWWGSLFSLPI